MGKYPSRDGLAVSPYELGFTEPTPEQITTHKRVEFHHIYHYGRYYDQESDGYGGIFYCIIKASEGVGTALARHSL